MPAPWAGDHRRQRAAAKQGGGKPPQSYPQELFAYSGFGGKFPTELKYAGYDGIVILGKAEKPVYLLVEDRDVSIRDAGHLWGLDTFETQRSLTAGHPKASVLTIGPAGETLCRFAILLNESASAAGQGGYGAVMGSKNLKAVVVRGTGSHKMADPDKFLSLAAERQKAGEWLTGGAQSWGRPPHPSVGERIRGEMTKKHLKRFAGCHGCPYQCMGFYDMPGVGKGAQMCVEAWYGSIDQKSSEGYWEGNILSQKLGINNFELFGLMQFVLEAVGKGVVSKKDLGLASISQIDHADEPTHGSPRVHHDFIASLLNGIADGKSLFSQGIARAAERLGPAAVQIYQELYPAYGYPTHWITSVGGALHWAMDTRDPFDSCHDYLAFGTNQSLAEHFGVPGGDIDNKGPSDYRGKNNLYDQVERQTAWVQNSQCLKNSLPVCEYASLPQTYYHAPEMDIQIFESRLLSAVTGIDYDTRRLWEAGDRIFNLRRAIMVLRENRERKDDIISQAWFERTPGGTSALSAPIDRKRWDDLVTRYYEYRGWDPKDGRPMRPRLEALGMKNVADKLGYPAA